MYGHHTTSERRQRSKVKCAAIQGKVRSDVQGKVCSSAKGKGSGSARPKEMPLPPLWLGFYVRALLQLAFTFPIASTASEAIYLLEK
jgi:hypothetical protein